MKSNQLALAIQPKERIFALDSMRGFAILGIFLVNMLSFHSPWVYLDMQKLWPALLDRWTLTFIDIFAQASFYTLFSLLFGYGMFIFIERLQEKGHSFHIYMFRRLLVLFFFGLFHAFLIWHGDILITYAITGCILLAFIKTRASVKLKWGIGLLLIPTVLIGGLLMLTSLTEPSHDYMYDPELGLEAIYIYSSGTWEQIFAQRAADWLYINNLANAPFLILSIFPMFLLGAYAAQANLLHQIEQNKRLFKQMFILSSSIGLCSKLVPYIIDPSHVGLLYLQDAIGGPGLAIAYASGIALLSIQVRTRIYLKPLAEVGRLSLSHYIFQSIVCTFIFYSYGLGWYGEVRPIYGVILNVFIFWLQILLSKWWLKRYSFGPLEWVWRRITYLNKAT